MDVKVIQAGLEHVDETAKLFDAYRQFYRQRPDRPAARRFLIDRLSQNQSVVLLALDESASPATGVGFVQLYPSFSSIRLKPIWILNDLFVAPEARRYGVARLLMNEAAAMARASGAVRVILSTAKDNKAAKALYVSLGYQLEELFDNYELPLV